MIRKPNVETEDLLLWAKYEQYRPSGKDLTKDEQAEEFLYGYIEEHIWQARLREKKQTITAERPVITYAS